MLIIGLLILGIYLVFYDEFYLIYRVCFKNKKAFYRYEKAFEKEIKNSNNLARLIRSTLGLDISGAVQMFMFVSVIFATLSYLVLSSKFTASFSLIISLIAFLIPYLILRIKLRLSRLKNANEGDIVIRELINAYNLTGKNMRATIEYLAINMKNAKNMKGVMLNLSKKINNVSDEEDIKRNIMDFRYQVNTSWADIIGMNIFFSIIKGIDVSAPLLDLSKAIDNSKVNKERIKRESNEGNLMILLVAPICYLLTVVAALLFFKFKLVKFLEYQFLTEAGVKWFLIVTFTYIVGLIAKSFINDNKLDI